MNLYYAQATYSDSSCSIPLNGVVRSNFNCSTTPVENCVRQEVTGQPVFWSKSICTTTSSHASAFRQLSPSNGFYAQGSCDMNDSYDTIYYQAFSGCSSNGNSSTLTGVNQNDIVTATYSGPNCKGNPYSVTKNRANECMHFRGGITRFFALYYGDNNLLTLPSPSNDIVLPFVDNTGSRTAYSINLAFNKADCTDPQTFSVDSVISCQNIDAQCESKIAGYYSSKQVCVEATSIQSAINKAYSGLDVATELSYSDSACTLPTDSLAGFGYAFLGTCIYQGLMAWDSYRLDGLYLMRESYSNSNCSGTPTSSYGGLVGQCRQEGDYYLKSQVYSQNVTSVPVSMPHISSDPSGQTSDGYALTPLLDTLLAAVLLL